MPKLFLANYFNKSVWKVKIWSPHANLFRIMVWLNLASNKSKAQLEHPQKISKGFKMTVLTQNSGTDRISICAHQKYWFLSVNSTLSVNSSSWYDISKLFANFKNKEWWNNTKVEVEQHESTLGYSLKLSINLDRMLNFFYFYKLLKVSLLFWLYSSTNLINLKIPIIRNKTNFEHKKEHYLKF